MKKDNNSKYYKDWTTAKLKDEWRGYNDAVNGIEWCYGTRDVRAMIAIENELASRDVFVKQTI